MELRPVLVALLAASLALAGCTQDAAPPAAACTMDCATQETQTMSFRGVLVDDALRPVPGASVRLAPGGHNTTTDAAGGFRFDGLPAETYLVNVSLDGRMIATGTVSPGQQTVRLVAPGLQPAPTEAYRSTQKFHGFLQCAHEALIISGSCDVLLTFTNDAVEPTAGRPLPEPLESDALFEYRVEPQWATMVIDISFDPDAQPGMDGMRAVLRGPTSGDDLNDYEQFGRWHGAEPFTVRLEPNGTYPDQKAELTSAQDLFRLEMLPHSHGYHTVCDPDETTCFLGAGAGADVAFEVVVTTFYVEPAPDAYTTLA